MELRVFADGYFSHQASLALADDHSPGISSIGSSDRSAFKSRRFVHTNRSPLTLTRNRGFTPKAASRTLDPETSVQLAALAVNRDTLAAQLEAEKTDAREQCRAYAPRLKILIQRPTAGSSVPNGSNTGSTLPNAGQSSMAPSSGSHT